ncbi:hypothetical protein TRVA0_015S01508 [Trichomonascus vanleenenianus]|uniref:She10p n=1 Tax=Trichomonascus vanleenenianus TaxID=2268995 RepID=UPI003ECB3550
MACKMRFKSLVLRLFVYYLIYLSIWKCPPSADPATLEDAPVLCKPLHHGFDLAAPYVKPYYSQYVDPAVQRIEPYWNKSVAAYSRYVEPGVRVVVSKASAVADPYAAKLVDAHARYVKPKIDLVRAKYDAQVRPVLDRACLAGQKTFDVLYSTYYGYVRPALEMARPYLEKSQRVARDKVYPVVKRYSLVVASIAKDYCLKGYDWVTTKVSPKVNSVYKDNFEPQLEKIQDRLLNRQDSSSTFSSVSAKVSEKLRDAAGEVTSAAATDSEDGLFEEEETITETIYETVRHTMSTTVEPERTHSPSQPKSDQPKSDLEHWKRVVRKLTKDAFNSFLDDVELEKANIAGGAEPVFTKLLQDLQHVQTKSIKELSALVSNIERTEADNGQPVGDEITPAMIQTRFRDAADEIRVAALAVRFEAEKVAQDAVNRTEMVRQATIEAFDEFSDAAIQEIGRMMVSVDSYGSSASSNGEADEGTIQWKDWKEYRKLKDRLLGTRKELNDFDINMSDINKMLREAQETANILAKETAQFLSAMRSKADFLLQQRIIEQRKNTDEEKEEGPVDAEIYEELEEDVPEDTNDGIDVEEDLEEEEEEEGEMPEAEDVEYIEPVEVAEKEDEDVEQAEEDDNEEQEKAEKVMNEGSSAKKHEEL